LLLDTKLHFDWLRGAGRALQSTVPPKLSFPYTSTIGTNR